jgi:hypothetical protein
VEKDAPALHLADQNGMERVATQLREFVEVHDMMFVSICLFFAVAVLAGGVTAVVDLQFTVGATATPKVATFAWSHTVMAATTFIHTWRQCDRGDNLFGHCDCC